MAIRLVEIVNLKTGDGGHAVLGLCGRQIFAKFFKFFPHSLGENFVIHHRRREAHGVGRIV